MPTEEYLSVPGYEISEVGFDEYLNSVPNDSLPAVSQLTPSQSAPLGVADVSGPNPIAPDHGVFVSEADLIKQPGRFSANS